MTTPRGIRNLNPLNIRRTSTTQWQGAAEVQRDAAFVTFRGMEWGIRAACRLLAGYRRRGVVTIEGIIARWAPPQDGNNTERYVSIVCRYMQEEPCYVVEPADWPQLLRVMAYVENGKWLEKELFEQGYSLWKLT